MLVTHYGIRRLQSNTLWAGFPSCGILLGGCGCWGGVGVQLARVASLSCHQTDQTERWREEGEREGGGKTLGCDPHTQSLTFIINYGCFCFISPQPLTTELLAVKGGEDGGQREEKRANFHQKRELSIKTSEMEPRLCQSPVEAMRTDGDLFGFNRNWASGERWVKI